VNEWHAPRGGNARRVAFIASAAILLLATGCYRAVHEPRPEEKPPAAASGTSNAQEARAEEFTVSPLPKAEKPAASVDVPSPASNAPKDAGKEIPVESPPPSVEAVPGTEPPPAVSWPGEGKNGKEPVSGAEKAGAAVPTTTAAGREANGKENSAGAPHPSSAPSVPRADAGSGRMVIASLSEEMAFPQDGPPWARKKEELVYKVEFLGLTMGYARFTFLGKVLLSGKEAYHLRVRAWTSDLLSLIYPIDDTIDYYLDVQTIVPLRQEFDNSRTEDDVAIYDQEKGTIVYRYKKDGTIRKKVDVVPNVYDPVSVAYYFRTRDLAAEEKGRPMYAGRKLWEISARPVGFERIQTDRGDVDTIIIQPVIRREGKVEDKGDLRMWISRDGRHLPIRLYAKFRKIRMWTLVGELMSDPQGG
jgi:hypothetical protein